MRLKLKSYVPIGQPYQSFQFIWLFEPSSSDEVTPVERDLSFSGPLGLQ